MTELDVLQIIRNNLTIHMEKSYESEGTALNLKMYLAGELIYHDWVIINNG